MNKVSSVIIPALCGVWSLAGPWLKGQESRETKAANVCETEFQRQERHAERIPQFHKVLFSIQLSANENTGMRKPPKARD